jgi:hypothetical protein
MRHKLLMLVLATLLTSACSTTRSAEYPHHAGRPSEGEARDAYFNTPVIVDEAGRELPIGMRLSAVTARFQGSAAVTYRNHGLACFVYPIAKTERWDKYGSPTASEWDLCFKHGRLEKKIRRA